MQLFEQGTGKFTPLTDEQLGTLNAAQVSAYNEVADAARALAESEATAETATASVRTDLAALKDAEKNEPRFDREAARVALVKDMIASNRTD